MQVLTRLRRLVAECGSGSRSMLECQQAHTKALREDDMLQAALIRSIVFDTEGCLSMMLHKSMVFEAQRHVSQRFATQVAVG